MKQILLFLLIILTVFPNLHAQKLNPHQKATLKAAQEIEPDVERLAMELWKHSETALLEYKSADLLIKYLEDNGFKVEKGVADMPTAFVASYGSGSPIIGILAEYDALPGIGNEPVPYKTPREDGTQGGQGCGHNLFGAASVGGAVAIKKAMEERKIKGTIRLYGTPAEETVVGKVYMAKAGLFDDLDACLDWHPGTENAVSDRPSLAMNNFTVEFFGQSAHSAADPWNGRSALDAVEMMNFGVNLMREHIQPSARIHYVIQDGGKAPNVVPDYAKVWYYVRDLDRESVEEYYQRILKVAEGAAIATRTEHKVFLITGVHERRFNTPMLNRIQQHLEYIGGPLFTEEEQTWGKELQKFTGKEEKGFISEVITPENQEPKRRGSGSTDVAEVSYICPEAGFGIATAPFGVPWHSWATAASHGTSAGVKGAQIATKVMSLTGIDLLTDEELLQAAKADFEKRAKGKKYQSPIPGDQKAPLPKE